VVKDVTSEAARPAVLDTQAVRAALEAQQREMGVFVFPQPSQQGACKERLVLRVDTELDEDVKEGQGVARAAVVVVIEPVSPGAKETRLEAVGGGEMLYGLGEKDVGRIYTELVARTAKDLVFGIVELERLRQADAKAVMAGLGSTQRDTRLAAATVAAERRLREAVPALIERLSDPDEEIRDRALGALVEIGDRRAVGPLTRLTQFRDIERMHKIIDAVASLGGEEARAYLELVASGHEEATVRQLAREGLARMQRKEAEEKKRERQLQP